MIICNKYSLHLESFHLPAIIDFIYFFGLIIFLCVRLYNFGIGVMVTLSYNTMKHHDGSYMRVSEKI